VENNSQINKIPQKKKGIQFLKMIAPKTKMKIAGK
jgi:hypothetical protein